MSKIYEVAYDWSSEAALILVYDGHTFDEVIEWFVTNMDNIDVRDNNVTGITENDFIEYGDPLRDDDENIVGRIVTKERLMEEFDPYMPSDIIKMLEGRY